VPCHRFLLGAGVEGDNMNCVNHPMQDAAYQCQYCQAPICVECERKLDGLSICVSCLTAKQERLAARYAAETQHVSWVAGAVSGALAGLLFALLWSQLSVALDWGLGPGAVVIGAVVGYSVMKGAGGKRGRALQQVSAILAILAVLCAHFLILLRTRGYAELGIPHSGSPAAAAAYAFPAYLSSVSLWDGLCFVLGAILGYWIPRPRVLRV